MPLPVVAGNGASHSPVRPPNTNALSGQVIPKRALLNSAPTEMREVTEVICSPRGHHDYLRGGQHATFSAGCQGYFGTPPPVAGLV